MIYKLFHVDGPFLDRNQVVDSDVILTAPRPGLPKPNIVAVKGYTGPPPPAKFYGLYVFKAGDYIIENTPGTRILYLSNLDTNERVQITSKFLVRQSSLAIGIDFGGSNLTVIVVGE